MTHELILTSVSQGLEPDSHGFCAVAEDQSIPRYLCKRLETLSDYQHLFPQDSEEFRLQPVVYSHLIFPGQDKTWHTLSRIADAGTDFQSNPNRLAHHIVLQKNEFVPEGPAWLLGLPGFHVTEWLTPSVRFPKGRPIPTLTAPPPLTRRQRIARERRWLDPYKMCPNIDQGEPSEEAIREAIRENEEQIVIAGPPNSPCPAWREMAGDEGWGGVLAETVQTGQEAVILFQPGQNLLPLFIEALSLLQPSLFWRCSFSTWYTRLPEHVTCQWKGILVGSHQATKLLQDRNILVIDLTRPIETAPSGSYVEFARTGIDGTLPADETGENFFRSEGDLETKPYSEDSAPLRVSGVSSSTSEKAEEDILKVAEPIGPGLIPPIIVEESPKVRSRSAAKKGGILGSFLNMKSRNQFYLLYGVTFLLVLFLLVLVLDQVADFGLVRSFQGSRTSPQVASPPKPAASKKAEPDADKPDPAVVREEQAKKRQEERERQKAAQQEKRAMLTKAKSLRDQYSKQKSTVRENLDNFLLDNRLPSTLSIPMPIVKNDLVDPPQPRIFPELASLYRFGLALELDYLPLLEIPSIRVRTKKLEFTRLLTSENSGLKAAPSPVIDEPPKLGDAVESDNEPTEVSPGEDLTVPDTDRFEWMVVAVEEETQQETPMFHLKLLPTGLEFSWMLEGMTQQYLYDTLAASLGFLRVSAEAEKDMSRVQSIAMFQPRMEKPIKVAERFADFDRPEFDVFMPFAVQPWKSLFETTKAPYEFRLEVHVSPDTMNMTEDTDSETATPSRFFGLFETEIQSAKPAGPGGALQYEPIEIAIEAQAGPDRIVWIDRYNDRVEELKKESEEGRTRLKELEDEIDKIAQQLVGGSLPAAEQRELRKQRTTLNNEKTTLNNRQKQVDDTLVKLPGAHEKLIKNEAFQFGFAAYLVPVFKDPEADHGRLRSEESLLLVKAVVETKKESIETGKPEGGKPEEEKTENGKNE